MDLNRTMREKKFYLAVLAAFIGIVSGATWPETSEEGALAAGTFLTTVSESLKTQTVLFLLPATAVLPCGDMYLRERQSNFLRLSVTRRGKKEYCLDRVFTTAISGALVWLAAAVLGTLFFFCLFFAGEEIWSWPEMPIVDLLTTAGRVCLTASVLSSLSAVCALSGGSVYLAYGLPFLLFYAGTILRDRYLETLYCIDPAEWIRAREDWGTAQAGLWLFLLSLALGCAVLHMLLLGRALEEI